MICHGPQFPELNRSLQITDEGAHIPLVCKVNFLWCRLRNATVASDEQAAVAALNEIHARGYARWEPAIDLFQKESGTRLLDVIEALKQECTARSRSEENFTPFAVILVVALWCRYSLSGDTASVQEALSLRSQLGPPGMYGFDFPLYSHAAAGEFNGMEVRPGFAKVLAAPSSSMVSRYSGVPEWESNPGRRGPLRPGFFDHLDHVYPTPRDQTGRFTALP